MWGAPFRSGITLVAAQIKGPNLIEFVGSPLGGNSQKLAARAIKIPTCPRATSDDRQHKLAFFGAVLIAPTQI